MHIPIKVDYGVRALVELAGNPSEGPLRTSEISKKAVIPGPFLAQVLHSLSKNGLIRSQRGPHGGHTLQMDPADIRLSMVMECLGGSDTMIGCLDDTGKCIHVPGCAQREVWQSIEKAIFNILDSTTISDLVDRTQAIESNRSHRNVPQHMNITAKGNM